ncbi:hypothetical protein ANDA3_1573 [plant metagenome]|uniref:Beta-ketoacyl-[acyl-carrier-protein] synthase III N-terminal domain-containing protein n=1 Tax=plant metagenome TaxID=1297885 RepID=A0A484QLH1_9ZZZZ
MDTTIAGVAYSLGEDAHDWDDLPDVDEALARMGLSREPELWGWGQYRRTRGQPVDLAVASARRTLAETGVMPGDIDAVLLCAAVFPGGVNEHRADTHRFLNSLGLDHAPLLGLTLSRCATLVCGIRLADDMLASGRYRHILVASFDAIRDEHERLASFALFSDAGASCLLSQEALPGYRLVASVAAMQATAGASDGLDGGGRLAAQANRQLSHASLQPSQLDKVCHDNLFLPILSMREQMAGFARPQLYLDNVTRLGHCFGCDPLINLADHAASSPLPDGVLLGVYSGTPGVRAGLVLQACGASAARPSHPRSLS